MSFHFRALQNVFLVSWYARRIDTDLQGLTNSLFLSRKEITHRVKLVYHSKFFWTPFFPAHLEKTVRRSGVP